MGDPPGVASGRFPFALAVSEVDKPAYVSVRTFAIGLSPASVRCFGPTFPCVPFERAHRWLLLGRSLARTLVRVKSSESCGCLVHVSCSFHALRVALADRGASDLPHKFVE